MKLLIVSNMSHYRQGSHIVGWGPTVQEIDQLATRFTEIKHIGCLHPTPALASSLPYSAPNISFIPLRPAGGKSWVDKLKILFLTPTYLLTMLRFLSWADVVHVRCPANIPLLAIILLSFVRRPKFRWVKYAGNWQPEGNEPWSYTFQRWWLHRGLYRGIVTINGKWPDQPDWVYSFPNPCLHQAELDNYKKVIEDKEVTTPLQLLYVGRVEAAKGVGRILEIAASLKKQGVAFELHIVGDGPEKPAFFKWTEDQGLNSNIYFHGWLAKPELPNFYIKAHIFLFPSASEGWPKVLSEAMAYGAVPLAGAVSSIPQILAQTGAGQALDPFDLDAYVQAISYYLAHVEEWKQASIAGMQAASLFTYDTYLATLKITFQDAWGLTLPSPQTG